jgi:uncharacterized membrane protein
VMAQLRRYFVTGFFVTVPLVISVATLYWIFDRVDGVMAPLYDRLLGFHLPGLGLLTTLFLVLLAGVVGTNVIGRRLMRRGEYYLLMVPVFRAVYAPVKQLILAFSPENDAGFKRVVLIADATRGSLLGFLTREFTAPGIAGAPDEALAAVYVPTNHLYLGDVLIVRMSELRYPDLTVEQGIRVFLTGGMALPASVPIRLLPLD